MKKFLSIFILFISIFSFAQTKKNTVSKKNVLPPNTQVWTINPERAQCEGATTMQCLLVQKQGQKSFEFFYDKIIGFDYEEGFTYVIWVKLSAVDRMTLMIGESETKYTLVKIVSKKGTSRVVEQQPVKIIKPTINVVNEPKTTTLVVNEEKINCEGNPNTKCLLIKKEGSKTFEIFYQNIDGFTFEEGYQQTILVSERYVANPMVKQAAPIYSYLKTIKKEQIFVPKTTTETANQKKSPLDRKWILRKMKDTDSTTSIIEGDGVFIDLKSYENKLSGNAPCNTFFGGLNTDNISTFQVVAVANTRMYCENNMKFEELFFTLLQNSERFELVGNVLSLYKGNRLLLVFE